MFQFKSTHRQLMDERRKNAQLTAQLIKVYADISYLAMMADVEMEDEQEEYHEQQEI